MCVIVMPQRQLICFFFNDVSLKSVFKILVRIIILSGFFFLVFFQHHIKVKKITAIDRFSITVLAGKTMMSKDNIPIYHNRNISDVEEVLEVFYLTV